MVDGQLDTFESLNSLDSMYTYDYVQVPAFFIAYTESASIVQVWQSLGFSILTGGSFLPLEDHSHPVLRQGEHRQLIQPDGDILL